MQGHCIRHVGYGDGAERIRRWPINAMLKLFMVVCHDYARMLKSREMHREHIRETLAIEFFSMSGKNLQAFRSDIDGWRDEYAILTS